MKLKDLIGIIDQDCPVLYPGKTVYDDEQCLFEETSFQLFNQDVKKICMVEGRYGREVLQIELQD